MQLKAELPNDPAISLLGTYLEKTIIQRDACTPMLIAALFTTAVTQKQLKCPLRDEQIKKVRCKYTYMRTYINTHIHFCIQ